MEKEVTKKQPTSVTSELRNRQNRKMLTEDN